MDKDGLGREGHCEEYVSEKQQSLMNEEMMEIRAEQCELRIWKTTFAYLYQCLFAATHQLLLASEAS